jgi:hypothetical protein
MLTMKNCFILLLLIVLLSNYSQAKNRIEGSPYYVSKNVADTVVLFIDYSDPLVKKAFDGKTSLAGVEVRSVSWHRYFYNDNKEAYLLVGFNERIPGSCIFTNFSKEKLSKFSYLSINEGSPTYWFEQMNILEETVLLLIDKDEFENASLTDTLLIYKVSITVLLGE